MNAKHAGSLAWDGPESDMLKKLWNEGKSGPEIAALLNARFKRGRTRMSVIGRAHRDGLGQRSKEAQRQIAIHNCKARAGKDDPQDGPSAERKAGLGKVWIKAPRLLAGQTPKDGHPITDVPPGGCKYALTANAPHTFCGRPAKTGSAYCPEHLKGLYQPATAPGNPHARKAAKDALR